jgi:hypothetical protein
MIWVRRRKEGPLCSDWSKSGSRCFSIKLDVLQNMAHFVWPKTTRKHLKSGGLCAPPRTVHFRKNAGILVFSAPKELRALLRTGGAFVAAPGPRSSTARDCGCGTASRLATPAFVTRFWVVRGYLLTSMCTWSCQRCRQVTRGEGKTDHLTIPPFAWQCAQALPTENGPWALSTGHGERRQLRR